LQQASRLVDVAKALRDFLPRHIGDPKHSTNRRWFVLGFPPARIAIPMP
jgi:hypothetical protein